MQTRKRRWPVAFEGILANLVLGILYTWSVFRSPLLVLYPKWTNGMLSIVFGLHQIFTCLGIMTAGYLSKRISMRKLFFCFACMALIGLGGIALLPASMPQLSYVLLLFLFSVVAATGVGFGINVIQSSTLAWFPDHTGFVSGALYMALGMSAFVMAALSAVTIPALGIKAAIAIVGGIVFIVSMLILADRKAVCLPALTDAQKAEGKQRTGMTTKEMLKTPTFWLLFLWNGCMRGAGFILLEHAADIAIAFAASALIGMLIAPANGFGSLSLGALLDRLGLKRNILVVCVLIAVSTISLIIGGRTGTTALIVLGLILGGISYGGSTSTYAAGIKVAFGERHFPSNFGIANFTIFFGAIISSFSGGILDAMGGEYESSIFVMLAVLLVPVLICGIAFQFFAPKKENNAEKQKCEN